MKTKNRNNQLGFIAFTSLLVISAVTLAIAISIPLLGITEANSSMGYKKSQETLKIAESCIEEGLIKLRDVPIYTGGMLTVGNGTCQINATGSGTLRTIDVTATISGQPQYIRKIHVTARRIGNSINLLSWEEVE
jgi:hypothetical protein